jgi:hypothetical protein
MKLIRMEKYKVKENDLGRNGNMVKMVADESSIMELMVHERIVRFIYENTYADGVMKQVLFHISFPPF